MVCLINDLVYSFKESNLLTIMLLVFKCNTEKLSLRFALLVNLLKSFGKLDIHSCLLLFFSIFALFSD